MEYNYCQYQEIREVTRNYIKGLRDLAKQENQKDHNALKRVITTEPRKGFSNNKYVDRLVIFLRGTGCSLARETGGCTFCGFYNATNFGVKIPDEDYISQITEVMGDAATEFDKYEIICLYNDGSMLQPEEISFDALLKILELLNEKEHIKKIVLEARVEDITEEKLKKLTAATTKEIEIAVGFESANPSIRDLCINKNFKNSVFEENCQLAKKYNVNIIPLLIFKPPFLTEEEAIEDYLNSLTYLEQFQLRRIDMELPTVETHTLVHELWKKEIYKPARLWSVIEILKLRKKLNLKTPIYISPPNYSVEAEVKTSNCPNCNDAINNAFQDYNKQGNPDVFNLINCDCKKEWETMLREEKWQGELSERVLEALKVIDLTVQQGS